MRILTRCVRVAVVAGALLALGLLILIPQARAFTGSWTTAKGDGLKTMTELSERSVVERQDGTTLAVLHADENRAPVKLKDVPDAVIKAVVGVEDDRFWKHHGIDLRGTIRALATNVSSGAVRQGGSTITQQLVKNSLLTPEKTVDRKVREALLAWRLEDQMSKNGILERYLNTVYFGNGAYGVQAAAEVYFGEPASQLDQAQAILLAGTIRNPAGYDPIRFPNAARARRRVVVDRLVQSHVITSDVGRTVLATPLPTGVKSLETAPNDYFVEQVKQDLLDDKRLGETVQERYNAVFKGGLRIVTTLDGDVSAAAHDAVTQILPDTNGKFVAALASIEPSTGAVKAIYGGSDFATQHFNLATQAHRQAGSSFKVMTLVAAIEEGYGPSTLIDGSSPCTVNFPGHKPYAPGNFEGEAGGTVTLTDATAHSINCAFVRLASVVGLNKVEQAAKDLGITSNLRVHDCNCVTPSMVLGGLEVGVSPLEMASAYATLAADGVYHKPYFVEKVVDRHGKVLFRGGSKGEQRVSVQTARQAVSILRSVVSSGTGTRANPGKWPVFGKTGTAQDYTDAWFVGGTRQLAAAVWMGSPTAKVPMHNIGGVASVVGGSFPARIWGQFMKTAMAGRPAVALPAPDPKDVTNKALPPSVGGGTTLLPGASTSTSLNPNGIGVIPVDGGPTTTVKGSPPPTSPPPTGGGGPPTSDCQEPPDWPDNYPPFCG